VSGYPVGIIVVDTDYPLLPGNVANATTYPFPVHIKVLRGVRGEDVMRFDPALTGPIIEAGFELLEAGVRAVVGACGSFANYQKDVAAALPVPVFLSVMLQTNLIEQGLQPHQSIGVIAARASALTERVFEQCGIANPGRLNIYSAMDLEECGKLFRAAPDFDNASLERDLTALARRIVAEHPETGAIIIQCSDLPPYAAAIERAVRLPVFDMTTLIDWVYRAVVRSEFRGYM
jgi:hypothetical protein